MRKFKGLKSVETISKDMTTMGMTVDESDLKRGDDWIKYNGVFCEMSLSIALNVCNGWFFVYALESGDLLASHVSKNKDNTEWYVKLLETVYEEAVSVSEEERGQQND